MAAADDVGLPHGTVIHKKLVAPGKSPKRDVYVDSSTSIVSPAQQPETPFNRSRWRLCDESAARVGKFVPHPKLGEKYYPFCSRIEMHHRCRQDSPHLEHKRIRHECLCGSTCLHQTCAWGIFSCRTPGPAAPQLGAQKTSTKRIPRSS